MALKDRMKHHPDRTLVYRLSKQLRRRQPLRPRRETAWRFIGAVACSGGFESKRQRRHSRGRMNRDAGGATEPPTEIAMERSIQHTVEQKTQVLTRELRLVSYIDRFAGVEQDHLEVERQLLAHDGTRSAIERFEDFL